MINARVEAGGLLARFKRLSYEAQEPVRRVVRENAEAMKQEARALVSKPKGRGSSAGSRSRPGQPPRKDSGDLYDSIRVRPGKASRRFDNAGMVMYVTVDADDGYGNRYPFMLESGTKKSGKRPFIKKAQRRVKKKFVREMTATIRKALK